MKQKLRNGEHVVLLLTDINVERGYLEDSLALGSYDAVYVDGQHSPLNEEKLAAFCQMTEEIGIPAQMRLTHTYNTYMMGRYCDFGLSSIMVPEVMEEKTVDEAIEFFYFGTRGRRSWGGKGYGIESFANPKVDRLAYADWWNDQGGVLALQLESVEGISRAARFANKEGVDYLAFGPNDLRFSLERNPGYPIRDPDDCIRNVVELVRDIDIPLCYALPTSGESREKYIGMGMRVHWESSKLKK